MPDRIGDIEKRLNRSGKAYDEFAHLLYCWQYYDFDAFLNGLMAQLHHRFRTIRLLTPYRVVVSTDEYYWLMGNL